MPLAQLTESKLKEMAVAHFKTKNVDIIKHNVKLATAKGDNYCGDVCAVDMVVKVDNGEEEELHWIVKTLPGEPLFPLHVIKARRLEEKEIFVYTEVIIYRIQLWCLFMFYLYPLTAHSGLEEDTG